MEGRETPTKQAGEEDSRTRVLRAVAVGLFCGVPSAMANEELDPGERVLAAGVLSSAAKNVLDIHGTRLSASSPGDEGPGSGDLVAVLMEDFDGSLAVAEGPEPQEKPPSECEAKLGYLIRAVRWVILNQATLECGAGREGRVKVRITLPFPIESTVAEEPTAERALVRAANESMKLARDCEEWRLNKERKRELFGEWAT